MIDRDRELLARDAQDASDALARFAKDVDAGIATGVLSQITQEMQQIVTRASSLKTAKEIVGLYEAERDIDDRTAER
jgi:hypothetical protein